MKERTKEILNWLFVGLLGLSYIFSYSPEGFSLFCKIVGGIGMLGYIIIKWIK